MVNGWEYSTYSKINSQVKNTFPFNEPRENQLETISEIVEAIDNGYKYIVLEAGTGTGKSAIAATLALMFDSTYILTKTKQLQDQYLNDFKNEGFVLVKGKSNFKCRKYAEDGIDETCEFGRCALEGYYCEYDAHVGNYKQKSKVCHYAYQKCVALDSDTVITNYAFFFYELNNLSGFKKRQLVVFDEAHNVENMVMDFLKLEFTREDLKENVGINLSKSLVDSLINGDYHDWINFVKRVVDAYKKELDKIEPLKKTSNDIAKKFNTLVQLKINCEDFIRYIGENPENWIVDYDKFDKKLSFKALMVDKYAKKYFFEHGDICLFMSATILDYKLFAEWLGIGEDEIFAIRRKSPFDVARNPIKTFDDYNLAYSSLSKNAPKTIDVIKDILNQHKDEKGLIHTVSNKCKNFIIKNIDDDRLIHHKNYNRIRQLEKYKNSKKPLVLVSPSMNEGVDLPGNQCRFQIIYKLPYPNFVDKQTNLRAKMDSQWYDYKTCLSLVQTYGRGMRFDRDFCKTYVIDSRFKNYVKKDELRNNFLPDSFRKAIDITPAPISDEDKFEKVSSTKENKITPFKNSGSDFNQLNSNKISQEYNQQYFKDLAIQITELPDYISDRDLLKHKETDFVPITDFNRINQKADLKNEGKELEKEDYEKAVEFYDGLKNNELFKNDYYPYRRQCILFKNKIKDDKRDLATIKEIFENEIYLNSHQYIWLTNKLRELFFKLRLNNSEISQFESLINEYFANEDQYENIQESLVPIAERIFKDEDGLKLLSKQKYDYMQEIYHVKELGVGYIRRKEYENAMNYYYSLLGSDFLYYRYHAYKQFARIFREMNDSDKFKKIYDNL